MLRQLPLPLQLEAAKLLRLELLAGSEIAAVLPESALARLTLEMTEVVVPPGELLLLEGDVTSTSMYIVMEGQFEVLATRPSLPVSANTAGARAWRAKCTASALIDYAAHTRPEKQHELPQVPDFPLAATACRPCAVAAAAPLTPHRCSSWRQSAEARRSAQRPSCSTTSHPRPRCGRRAARACSSSIVRSLRACCGGVASHRTEVISRG